MLPLNKLRNLVRLEEAINRIERLYKAASQHPSNNVHLEDLAIRYFQIIKLNPDIIKRCDAKLAQEVGYLIAKEHGANDVFGLYESVPEALVALASEHMASADIMHHSMQVTLDSFGNDEFPKVLASKISDALSKDTEDKKKLITEIIRHLLTELNVVI